MPELRVDPLRVHPRSVLLAVVEAEASAKLTRRKLALLEVLVARSLPARLACLEARLEQLAAAPVARARRLLHRSRLAAVAVEAAERITPPPVLSSAAMVVRAEATAVVAVAAALARLQLRPVKAVQAARVPTASSSSSRAKEIP